MKDKRKLVQDWNLESVKQFLVKRWKHTIQEAEALIVEYRRFMILTVENQSQRIPVSEVVDEVWHAHILQTEDYAAFCQAIVGSFIQHRIPQNEAERISLARDYSRTLDLYRQEFGVANPGLWGENAQICWGDTIEVMHTSTKMG